MTVRGSVVRTVPRAGVPRLWGVCEECGQVDEISARQVASWLRLRLCRGCDDRQPERVVRRDYYGAIV